MVRGGPLDSLTRRPLTSWSGIQHLFHQFNLAERDQLRVKLPNELLGAPSAAFSPKLRVAAESDHRFHKSTMVAGLGIITVVSDVRCVQSERIVIRGGDRNADVLAERK